MKFSQFDRTPHYTEMRSCRLSGSFENVVKISILTKQPIDDFDSDGDGDKRFQWDLFNYGEYFDGSSDRVGIMLNTDIELAYSIDNDMFDGTSCVIGDAISGTQCAHSDTYNTVVSYANVSL